MSRRLFCLLAALLAGTASAQLATTTEVVVPVPEFPGLAETPPINEEVIAVDQDPLGVQGFPHKRMANGLEVWFKPLENDAWAMAVLNRVDAPQTLTFEWAEEHVEDAFSQHRPHFDQHRYALRDLFAHADAGTTEGTLTLTVPSRDVKMYRLTRM